MTDFFSDAGLGAEPQEKGGATEKGSILEKLVLFMPKNAKKTH